MSFMQYMDKYFVEENKLADTLKISTSQLLKFTKLGVIPSYSYHIISENFLETVVFGKLQIEQGIPGKYYSKSVQHWFNKAQKVVAHYPSNQIRKKLQNQFLLDYSQQIKQLPKLTQLFPDLFDNQGTLLEPQLKNKAEQTWNDHLNGSYGLCVVNPNSVSAIIEKQIAVRRLASATENGNKSKFSQQQQTEFFVAAEKFDQVAMPFSPADYPLSSRKRLLDDIKTRLVS
ncbi:MAG: DUF6058 family natural product biosynthesis protein [Pseudomonadales bacterium]|nr:DUF6058 family natural product biosynthesis protein [Pseudomonadales bacterium]NRA14061.1 hypothetical protein [Oceanospirillaceae bacterium]